MALALFSLQHEEVAMEFHYKGMRRAHKDLDRKINGEPRQNREHNTTLHSKYPETEKAHRLKGRARFKTGKKSGKKGG